MSRAAALLVAVALSGCASVPVPGVQRDDLFRAERPEANQVKVVVENRNFSDARLFAVTIGKRIGLGVVGGKDAATFTIPWAYPEPLQIEIDLFTGPRCTTRAIETDPGDTLDLQIESTFDRTRGCN